MRSGRKRSLGKSVKRKKRERRVRAKWNRRLLPQVGLIIALIFVLTIVASTFIQVKGSMSTYLEAKKEELLMSKVTHMFVHYSDSKEMTRVKNAIRALDC